MMATPTVAWDWFVKDCVSIMQNLLLQEFIRYTESRFGQPVLERVVAREAREAILRSAPWRFVEASELDRVVAAVTGETGVAAGDLLRGFGQSLFCTLINLPLLQPDCDDLFEYLKLLETGFYAELEDLLPDIELPRLVCCRRDEQTLEVIYGSPRRWGSLAQGLIEACIGHFRERVILRRFEDPGDPEEVRFVLTRPEWRSSVGLPLRG